MPGTLDMGVGVGVSHRPPAARYEEETQRLRVRPLATAPTVRRGQGSQAAPQRPLNREGGRWPPDPSGPEGEPAHTGARGTERSPQAGARKGSARSGAGAGARVCHAFIASQSPRICCHFVSIQKLVFQTLAQLTGHPNHVGLQKGLRDLGLACELTSCPDEDTAWRPP